MPGLQKNALSLQSGPFHYHTVITNRGPVAYLSHIDPEHATEPICANINEE